MTEQKQISRRTVAKGIAWSVPAITLASALPAHAVSGVIIPSALGSACKHPGNPKYYHFQFAFTNTSTDDITVSLTSMTVNGVNKTNVQPVSIVANGSDTTCYHVDGGLFADSANGSATLYFEYTFGGETIEDDVSTGVLEDLPPCGTGADPGKNPGGDPPHANGGLFTCPT